ncbi:MAG: peptidylprolyl isomerase [Clostridia bacterium]|nr:peptidylprolyl isomerase [Clostridia bacterium]
MKKIFNKAVCGLLAGVSVFGSAVMLGGCTTNHPEVEMQIAFNGEKYTLEYTLYRKFAPNTVTHFLQLAEEGYYNELVVHDYSDDKLYTGGYKYDANKADDGGLVYQNYFDIVKGYENYEHSVWADSAKNVPTYTLYGEFSANNVKMGSGSFLKQDFGSLTMFYTDKSSNDDVVTVEKIDGSGTDTKEYRYNSATSLFYIQLGSSASASSKYCTFAKLKEGSVDTLEDLQDAIKAYIDSVYGEETTPEKAFAPDVSVAVDEDDPYVGDADYEATYNVPKQPIKINYVKVLKF